MPECVRCSLLVVGPDRLGRRARDDRVARHRHWQAQLDAVSSAVWVPLAHPDAGFENTYTAAAGVPVGPSTGAPATIVWPVSATDDPSPSGKLASDAVSTAAGAAFAHPEAGSVNTHTAPGLM